MKYFVLSLFVLILGGCQNPIFNKGNWTNVAIPAPSLKNSLIESESEKTIGVYLPPSYQSNLDKKYPVVYFLHGYGGGVSKEGYTCWLLDSLIQSKLVPEMIMVEVSGRYTFHGSFYENSPVTGNWEDFVIKDVIGYVDANYRTIAKSGSRAISGHSMGGYGTLNLGMLHPEVFQVVYGMSPGVFNEEGLAESQLFKNGGTIRPVIDLLNKLKPLGKQEAHRVYLEHVKSIQDWNVEFTLAYGMTFAPQTDKAPYFEYPLAVIGTDTIRNEEVWQKWEKGFGGVSMEMEQYQSNFAKLKLLGLDCGYHDDFRWIVDGTLYYSKLLVEKQLPHVMNWHSGTHGSRFNESVEKGLFPTVVTALEFE